LRASTGPLGTYFRNLVPDVNGLETLNPELLKSKWAAEVERISDHYGFDKAQREKAGEALKQASDFADVWFSDREKIEQREKYFHELLGVMQVEKNLNSLSFERERAWSKRTELQNERKILTADLDGQTNKLNAALTAIATPEQREAAGAPK